MIGSRTSGDARLLPLAGTGDFFLNSQKETFLIYQKSLIPSQQGPKLQQPDTAQCRGIVLSFHTPPILSKFVKTIFLASCLDQTQTQYRSQSTR